MFNQIVGNEQNKKTLENIIKAESVAHSYIFSGKDSIGKILFAKEFAKAILCLENEKPCNACKSCIQFDSSNNPDFRIVEPDGNTIKIDQIREITKNVYEKPIVSNKKVYIINDAELMTKEAQNSLLKTLEEPPSYVTIILITSNDNLFLPTIKSRCTKISFNKLEDEELKNVLQTKCDISNVSELVLKIADGSVKKALNIIDKEDKYKNINDIYENLEKISMIDIINSKENIFKDKDDTDEILDYINLIFFDKIRENIKYTKCMQIVEDTKDRLRKNSNYDMTIDNLNMTIWEEING